MGQGQTAEIDVRRGSRWETPELNRVGGGVAGGRRGGLARSMARKLRPEFPVALALLLVTDGQLHEIPQVTVDGVLSPFLTLSGTSGQRREMVVGTGFEPV